MTEAYTPVDEIFSTPNFDHALTDWQRSRGATLVAEQSLAAKLAAAYDVDPTLSQQDVDYHVSADLALGRAYFEENCGYDTGYVTYWDNMDSANATEDGAKHVLLQTSKQLGVSEFAVYGLYLHTQRHGVHTRPELNILVKKTEEDFLEVDQAIRQHNGNLLTLSRGIGVYAGKLGEGGVTLSDDFDKVILPLAEGVKCYAVATSKMTESPEEIFVEDEMSVPPYFISSILGSRNMRVMKEWSQLLDVGNWRNKDPFMVFGDPVNGDLRIPETTKKIKVEDREYLNWKFSQIRSVGLAALAAESNI